MNRYVPAKLLCYNMSEQKINTAEIPVAVVGLGLMGCSITTCLLMAGHPVVAVAPIAIDMLTAHPRILEHLKKSKEEELTNIPPDIYLSKLTITEDYGQLKNCLL